MVKVIFKGVTLEKHEFGGVYSNVVLDTRKNFEYTSDCTSDLFQRNNFPYIAGDTEFKLEIEDQEFIFATKDFLTQYSNYLRQIILVDDESEYKSILHVSPKKYSCMSTFNGVTHVIEGILLSHTALKKGEENELKIISKTMIGVKFPDNRGRYVGKEYYYELADNLSTPSVSSHIHIKKVCLRDKGTIVYGTPYVPHYDNKSVLVTGVKTFAHANLKDVYSDIGIYYGINDWKTITDYDLISSINDSEPDEIDMRATEKMTFENMEPLTPLKEKEKSDEKPRFVIDATGDGPPTLYINGTDGSFKASVDEMTWIPDPLGPSIKSNEGEKRMNKNVFGNVMKNFQFGKVDSDKIAYSVQGIAFKNTNGDYVTYNAEGTAVNCAGLGFDVPLFAMPVPLAQVALGDIIVHNQKDNFVIVRNIDKNYIEAIEPASNEIIKIVPQKSIFGFDFYTKIVHPMGMLGTQADATNPFGNILPFMLMGDGEMDTDMLMVLAMSGNFGGNMNAILPFMLMKNGSNDMGTVMAMMMMMNQNGGLFGAPASTSTQE